MKARAKGQFKAVLAEMLQKVFDDVTLALRVAGSQYVRITENCWLPSQHGEIPEISSHACLARALQLSGVTKLIVNLRRLLLPGL